jgi:hypothetical protein
MTPSISFHALARLGSVMMLIEFLRRERDSPLSAAIHLHSASVYAGSPRTSPKNFKHPWIKLGVASWKEAFSGISCRLALALGVAVRG